MEQDFYKQTVCEKHSLLLFRGKLVTKEPMVSIWEKAGT